VTARLIAWIDTLSLHQTVRDAGWVVPSMQTIHILAVSVVVASSLILSLRLLAVTGTDWSPMQWTHRLRPWLWWALLALLMTGLVLILGEPERTLGNRTFQAKMLALIIAIGLSLTLFRRTREIGAGQNPAGLDRAIGVALMLVWVFIVLAGRWIAYS
jgi:hypothetical protein